MDKKELFLVPYSHLDTQWRWDYPTTIKWLIRRTMRKNFRLFKKYPHYVFNFTGSRRYSLMKEYYPEDYKKVQEYVKMGKWVPGGACIDETDALTPSAESLIRNILYGREYQKKEFGVVYKDYMLPDCFGFPTNFPTLLKHCDVTGFSTGKLEWHSANGIPFNQGIWEGPDGSKLLCALNPGNYMSHMFVPPTKIKKRTQKVEEFGEKTGVYKSYQYYGVGDFGGSPSLISIWNAERDIKKPGDIKVVQGASEDFYKNLTDDEISKFDTYTGDLLLIEHSAGTLTTNGPIKRLNRMNERMAYAAEYVALLAEKVAGVPYPKEEIEKTWYKVVGSQMHDIIPGTCLPSAYKYSYNDEIIALKTWRKIIDDSIQAIYPHLEGGEIVIFNPADYERQTICEFEIPGFDFSKKYGLKDSEGNIYPISLTNKNTMISAPYLKPFEIKRYSIVTVEKKKTPLTFKLDNGITMENEYISISISKEGEIYSIKDKVKGKEILESPLAYHLLEEKPVKYPGWNMYWKDRQKEPKDVLTKGYVQIIEDNSTRKKISITTQYNKSTFTKIVSLGKDDKMITFEEQLEWKEKGKSLKVALPLAMDNPTFLTNMETCFVEKGVNNEKQFEVPSRYLVKAMSDQYGVALIENCKYGYDIPKDNMLRMTLVYTPLGKITALNYEQYFSDWGAHYISYAIYPFEKDDAEQQAQLFNNTNKIYLADKIVKDIKEAKLFDLDYSKLGVLAVKKSEDDSGMILRLYNRTDDTVSSTIKFYEDIKEAYLVNGVEDVIEKIDVKDNLLNVSILKSSICTVKVVFAIKNELNTKEIINSDNYKDAIDCKGQTINIDEGYNKLSLYVIAKNKDKFTVKINDRYITNDVSSSYGFMISYNERKWLLPQFSAFLHTLDHVWFNFYAGLKKNYVNNDKLGTYFTHYDTKDNYYKHLHIYRIDVDTKGAKSIELPNNENIKVLSMIAWNGTCIVKDIEKKKDMLYI